MGLLKRRVRDKMGLFWEIEYRVTWGYLDSRRIDRELELLERQVKDEIESDRLFAKSKVKMGLSECRVNLSWKYFEVGQWMRLDSL